MGKRGVDAAAGAHQAEAVRPQQAHAVALGAIDHGAGEIGTARSHFSEAARNHDRVTGTGAAAGINNAGHCRRLGADHHQIKALRNTFHRVVGLLAKHRFVTWIDQEQLAFEAAIHDVANQGGANGTGRFRSTDDGDRLRFKKWGQIVLFVVHFL